MSRLMYSCRFDVSDKEGLSSVFSTYKDWIVYHRNYREIPEFSFDLEVDGAPKGLPDDHSLTCSAYENGGERVVCIHWSFPDDNDAGLRWVNDIRIGQFGDHCGVEHLISIESVEYSVAPARLHFGSPKAIRDTCAKVPVYIGKMKVCAEPYVLKQEKLNVLRDLLTCEFRKLPVVLLSPYPDGKLNWIDRDRLAHNLAGVAVVVSVEEPELTWDFTNDVGRRLSCFDGAVRIYWPKFSKASDPRYHRLFLGSWIEQVGPETAAIRIEQTIFAVAVYRYVPDKRIVDLIHHAEAAERQKVLERNRKNSENEFLDDFDKALNEIEKLKEQNANLEAENANLRTNQEVFLSIEPEELAQTETTENLDLSSVSKAVEEAGKRFDNLVILPSAKSAATKSPYYRPEIVYDKLQALNETVDDWEKNHDETGSGGDYIQLLRARGCGKRVASHISDTTRGKFRSDYEFEYQGKKQLFEPHITIGSGNPNKCASIHFIFDHTRLKMVVGHVGIHLPNLNS